MKRAPTVADLRDKGFPFECLNCGNKPTPTQVLEHGGDCECCGDTIIAYTIDTAEYIAKIIYQHG
jgi:hypothetical protein